MNKIAYPFAPRSAAYLLPGQFWAVPLRDGRFACGRVLQRFYSRAFYHGRSEAELHPRWLLAGLLDWVGAEPPSFDSIAGRRVLRQGPIHVAVIRRTGGEILGHRPLELDGVEPATFISGLGSSDCLLLHGTKPVRPATPVERRTIPALSIWGPGVLPALAEDHLGSTARSPTSLPSA